MAATAADYRVRTSQVDGIAVVHLEDTARHVEVSIAPSIGNLAYEMKVNGKNLFWVPFQSLGEMKANPALCGNPFLAPFANRIDQDAFYVEGRKYLLNGELGNLRRDGNQKPIHGLLMFSHLWKVIEHHADGGAAWVTSHLEFWKHPELMAQFPFAHSLYMTYRLSKGVLEVETEIRNLSAASMPVAIGYHPYFRLHDAPRDEWTVHVAAKRHYSLSPQLIPTGETEAVNLPDPVSLATTQLDDVFGGLVRGSDGRAEFWVKGKKETVSVTYGPKYPVAVIYAPKGREFICFEPMSAITNAFNLAHGGVYKEMQTIPPGGTWKESFWIRGTGF
ncbi:MAG: aldose 1-epimerase [Bryobacteraceae bacterium]